MAQKKKVEDEAAEVESTFPAQYRLTFRHIQALREGALERAAGKKGAPRPDASALLREILDAWMAKGGKR